MKGRGIVCQFINIGLVLLQQVLYIINVVSDLFSFLVEACLGLLSIAMVLNLLIKTLMSGWKAWGKEAYKEEDRGLSSPSTSF